MSATRQLKMMQNVSIVVARQIRRVKWYNIGEADETFRDSYVHGLCRDGIGAVSPSACRGGGYEGGDGAVWGCVFTGTVPGRFPVDPWWEACEVHGGYLPRCMAGTSRGAWWVPPEVHGGCLPR